jgi:hypothetical protein
VPDTTQALESEFAWIRTQIVQRKFSLRNRPRTNLLLELLRIHLNDEDDERAYAREIRLHLESREGAANPRHLIKDPWGYSSLRGR